MELLSQINGTLVAGAANSLVSSSSSGLQDVIIGYRKPNTNKN